MGQSDFEYGVKWLLVGAKWLDTYPLKRTKASSVSICELIQMLLCTWLKSDYLWFISEQKLSPRMTSKGFGLFIASELDIICSHITKKLPKTTCVMVAISATINFFGYICWRCDGYNYFVETCKQQLTPIKEFKVSSNAHPFITFSLVAIVYSKHFLGHSNDCPLVTAEFIGVRFII